MAKGRTDADGPLFPLEEPTCPTWLIAEAKAEWRRMVGQLMAAGLLSKANRSTLAAYCDAWGRWHEAAAVLKAEGKVLTSPAGYKYAHPMVTQARDARTEMVKLAADFGMTPASAGKVQRAAPEDKEDAGEKNKGRFFKTVG